MLTKDNSLDQLIKGIYNHGPDILPWCDTTEDLSDYLNRIIEEHLNYPIPASETNNTNWLIPNEYLNLNIEEYCLSLCQTQEEIDRVTLELSLYKKNDMLIVLNCMKYIVDTLRKNNIVWGVGRGSSVSSYCLFLLGVHKINSLQYELPLEEFFK